jgi:hypothetical protein
VRPLNSIVRRRIGEFRLADRSNEALRDAVKSALDRFAIKTTVYANSSVYVIKATAAARKETTELAKELRKVEERLAYEQLNADQYFRCVLFVGHISDAEIFLEDVIRAVITKHPKKVGSIQFKLGDVIDAADTDELISRASEEFLYKILYKKPQEYLAEICNVLSIDATCLKPFWSHYIEAKARRDLGVHNRWICTATYVRKIEEAGIECPCKVGQRLLPSDGDYPGLVARSLLDLAEVISDEVLKVHGPRQPEEPDSNSDA